MYRHVSCPLSRRGLGIDIRPLASAIKRFPPAGFHGAYELVSLVSSWLAVGLAFPLGLGRG